MTSTKELKAAKEDWIMEAVADGITSGSELERGMRNKFGMNVSARFRQETQNLIKNDYLTREGTGENAVFGLGRKKYKKATVADKVESNEVAKPVKATPVAQAPAPDPVPAAPAVEQFDANWMKDVGSKVLHYLALQGDRPVDVVLRKALDNDYSYHTLGQFVLMGKRGLLQELGGKLSVTKEGRKCLDDVRAGVNFR